MVGIIHRREQVKVPEPSFNPDDMFDPTTHIATEENFMKLLDNGVYDSKYIGYKVQLSNSVDYNNGLWVIADVNHDSENTGQTSCYDLISQDCFCSIKFGNSSSWRSSTPRTWLNNTFYPGFSTEFKSHILNPKYKSRDTWYTDDYVILPSYKEVNGGNSTYQENEGVAYPIFTDTNSRIKKYSGTSSNEAWWTRSRRRNNSNYAWSVNADGSMSGVTLYSSSCYLAPVLRVS